MKREYQPKKKRTIRKLGFMARNATPDGKNVLKRRRAKGRASLSKTEAYKLLRKHPRSTIR